MKQLAHHTWLTVRGPILAIALMLLTATFLPGGNTPTAT